MIRSITDNDWPVILDIQAAVYPDITPETETVLRSKLTLGPQTCLALTDQQNCVVGYCLAHPWSRDPAGLHTIYPTIVAAATYFTSMIWLLHLSTQVNDSVVRL